MKGGVQRDAALECREAAGFRRRPHAFVFSCAPRGAGARYGASQSSSSIGGVQNAPPSVIVWLPPFSVASTSNS